MAKKQIRERAPEPIMQAKGIRRGDRVRIIGTWPNRATGQVSHIVAAGGPKLLANVKFDRPHTVKGNQYTYNWYEEGQLEKL
ncbi:MAG TPA: hypothetical protein VFA10_27360 [Ktedonobacteraceae bacterium]|nr:hypothetical protein [Ktedonobacteraceae bacterium]